MFSPGDRLYRLFRAPFRRNSPRKPHLHPTIIVAPAPPPAYITLHRQSNSESVNDPLISHLSNSGNRIFHLAPDKRRLLSSGNIGACMSPEIHGRPTLLATLPPRLWRDLLRLFMRLRDEVVNSRIGRRRGELEWVRRCGIEVPELCRRCEKEDGCKEEGGWIEVWEAVVTNYHTRIVADLMPGIPGQNVETVEGKYRWASRTLVIHLDFEVGFAHYPVEPREDLFVGRWTEGYLDGKEEGMLVDSRSWFDVITRRSADSGELEVQAPEDDDDD